MQNIKGLTMGYEQQREDNSRSSGGWAWDAGRWPYSKAMATSNGQASNCLGHRTFYVQSFGVASCCCAS